MPIPIIRSEAHRAHDGLVELYGGRELPCFEAPARVDAVLDALRSDPAFALEAPAEHGLEPIIAVHDPGMVDLLEHVWTDALAAGASAERPVIPDTFRTTELVRRHEPGDSPHNRWRRLGAHCFDTATPIVAGTYAAARGAVDVALTAAERVAAGAPLAFAACRPPGHHAGPTTFGGYCFFNNAAIVAQQFVRDGAERVAILDLDFHHGNGTQQLFWERGDVLYVSVHGDPRGAYPYFTGYPDETGAGAGAGRTRNLPLDPGTPLPGYLAALERALGAVDDFGPDAPIIVSLGLDTHRRDPITDLGLETDDYPALGSRVGELHRPTVVLLEGGYALDVLGPATHGFLRALHDRLAAT